MILKAVGIKGNLGKSEGRLKSALEHLRTKKQQSSEGWSAFCGRRALYGVACKDE